MGNSFYVKPLYCNYLYYGCIYMVGLILQYKEPVEEPSSDIPTIRQVNESLFWLQTSICKPSDNKYKP